MRNDKENLIVEKSIRFAIKIVAFSEKLEEAKKYVLAKQLLKAGTAIGANIREAQNAESKPDFIHKMKIAAKKQMKLIIGCCFAANLKIIHMIIACIMSFWRLYRLSQG